MHHFSRFYILVLPALVAIFCAVEVMAATAVLNMRDGRVIRAELLDETESEFSIRIAGIRTVINKDDVESYEVVKTPAEAFQARRDQLESTDLEGRYALAYEFFELREYDVVETELQSMMRDFEDEERIELLLRIVRERKKLQEEAEHRNAEDHTPPAQRQSRVSSALVPETSDSAELPKLTDRDINLIKVWELPADFDTELRPHITIPPDILREIVRIYADDPRIPKGRVEQQRLLREQGYVHLKLMFDLRAQRFYGDAVMRGDPPVMAEFRRQVNPQYIVRYFARYFGDGQVPGLKLITDQPTLEANAYTNFYILSQFRYNGRAMIDRLQPENSLLLQWGLARELAEYPAPDIQGWQPRFRTKTDPMYSMVLNWIQSLYNNVDYGINYQMPASQPSEDASSQED